MAVLISDPVNIFYLTGFSGHGNTYLLLSGDKKYLYTNALYRQQAETISHTIPLTIRITDGNIWELLKRDIDSTTLEIEESAFTVSEYKKLSACIPNISFIPHTGPNRQIKTNQEASYIRTASEITDATFSYILTQLSPGISEKALAQKIIIFLYEHETQPAFDPIVAFDDASSEPHYIPSDRKLAKNSSILFDFGAKYQQYCSDMCRMVYLKKPSLTIQKAYSAVLKSQIHALDSISHGERSGAALDLQAKKYIKSMDFEPYSHGLGHGVGLEIHEHPRLSIKKDMVLSPGMTFTVEPGIYEPGKFGIRIEDTVYLGKNGLEILTKTPKELCVL